MADAVAAGDGTAPRFWRRLNRLQRVLLAISLTVLLPGMFLQFLIGPVVALVIGPVDRVLVDKSARRLSLMRDVKPVFSVAISLGRNPVGQKQREGDGRTPEGTYRLVWRDSESDHHRAILISYPNQAQSLLARDQGIAPGGEIMVHGQKYFWRWFTRSPLTNGCIGLSNTAMDIVWSAVELGTPITIRP